MPFLVIGDHILIGSEQIPTELPYLIDAYLASGDVDWPKKPGLEAAAIIVRLNLFNLDAALRRIKSGGLNDGKYTA